MQPKYPSDSIASAAQTSLDRLQAALAVASGLATAGRSIDLRGIESAAGLLCAQVLDLPPADGQVFRPSLVALNSTITNLIGFLQARA